MAVSGDNQQQSMDKEWNTASRGQAAQISTDQLTVKAPFLAQSFLIYTCCHLVMSLESTTLNSTTMQMTPTYMFLYSPDYLSPLDNLISCLTDINTWMSQNVLQLNKEKTEVTIFGAKAQREQVSVHLKSLGLHTENQVKNRGIILDSGLRFDPHIRNVTKISRRKHMKHSQGKSSSLTG